MALSNDVKKKIKEFSDSSRVPYEDLLREFERNIELNTRETTHSYIASVPSRPGFRFILFLVRHNGCWDSYEGYSAWRNLQRTR